jgi:hypothetical protein
MFVVRRCGCLRLLGGRACPPDAALHQLLGAQVSVHPAEPAEHGCVAGAETQTLPAGR